MMNKLAILCAFSSSVFGACAPEPGVTCYPDDCKTRLCLGPENVIANAPVRPLTCDGDWSIVVAGLYWRAHQDGMEYAINDPVFVQVVNPSLADLRQMNNLIDSHYETAGSNRNFGFKLGVGYSSPCDGWDVGLVWTRFSSCSSTHVETEPSDNHVLIALWSAFGSQHGNPIFARDIETHWTVELDLVDLELGREFWVSKFLSVRPFIAFRYGNIDQSYDIDHKGGSWSPRSNGSPQDPLTNEVRIQSQYDGFGLKSGIQTTWNLGCGWGLYGEASTSILYGRFEIDHQEQNRLAISPYTKRHVMETDDHFRASRAILDFGLGIQWSALVCDCKYGLQIAFGWEQHLFFHQNQMWRVMRKANFLMGSNPPNNRGENTFIQSRGNLDTQGITLKIKFNF